MKTQFFLSGLLALALTVQLTGCQQDTETTPLDSGMRYGNTVKLGNGTARAFVQVDAGGTPKQVGVAISEAAMNSLPDAGADLVLDFPTEAGRTLFKHIALGYLHHGHDPVGVYDKPHFDVHFYTISNAERMSITMDKQAQLAKAPAPAYLPTGHINAGAVPAMGVHWIDPTSDEFSAKGFSKTFIYGAYDGKVIFYEPMLTTAYLKATPDELTPIKQPQKVAQAGYYPGAYRVRYNATDKQYEIALDQLTMKH